MQALYIFRGCLAAYAAGVIVVSLGSMIVDDDGLEVFGIVAIFGLIALVPMLIITFIIWGILAVKGAHVLAWQAIVLCAAVFFSLSALGTLLDGELLVGLVASVVSPMIGGAFGAAFWFGAFGLRRDMVMGTRMPADWWA